MMLKTILLLASEMEVKIKQDIPLQEINKIIQIIEKQDIPLPAIKEFLQFTEIANKLPKKEFVPTMKTLLRIMKSMKENRSTGKTSLALKTNLNYGRLSSHIDWLEDKGLVESIISDKKINVILTQKGRTRFHTVRLTMAGKQETCL
jgi:predicted transcriptional regulator